MLQLQRLYSRINAVTQNLLLNTFDGRPVFYVIFIGVLRGKEVYKFGYTNNIVERFTRHLKEIGDHIILINAVENIQNAELERRFKKDPRLQKYLLKKKINNKTQTELVKTDTNFTAENFHNIVLEIGSQLDKIKNQDIFLEWEKVKYDRAKLDMQIEVKRLELEMMKLQLNSTKISTTTTPEEHDDSLKYKN